MIPHCSKQIAESSRRADDYYRTITAWLVSRRRNGSRKAVLRVASLYKQSLDLSIRCLRRVKPSVRVDAAIGRLEDYRSMLAADIRRLENSRGPTAEFAPEPPVGDDLPNTSLSG